MYHNAVEFSDLRIRSATNNTLVFLHIRKEKTRYTNVNNKTRTKSMYMKVVVVIIKRAMTFK